MIRKLRSGGYRLHSRKINPNTGKRRNLGTFNTRAAWRSPDPTLKAARSTVVAQCQ
jgi:hypothetical protein